MTNSQSLMSAEDSRLSRLAIFLLVFAAGAMFCAVHIVNGWLLQSIEVTDHISFLYLPSFLRIMNVLVLGMLWGTAGTAVGGGLLFFYMQDSLLLSVMNTIVSAGSAALAVWCMQIFLQRKLSLSRLSDLLQLALLNALLNALFHHLVWGQLDSSQLVSPNQLAYMMIGDINGAIVGALSLRWLATHTSVIEYARQQAATKPSNESDQA
jgi:hypothetical protein